MSRRNLTILFAAVLIGLLCYSRSERNPFARAASNAYRLINERSLENPPDEALFSGAVRGMVDVLRQHGDVHSAYLEPSSAEPLREELRQEFGGVGIRVGVVGDPPQITIVEPPQPGTPAYDSPLRAGDVILAVDGADTTGRSMQEVVTWMRGPVGAVVEMTVRHPDLTDDTFRLTRQIIRVPSVIGDYRNRDGSWQFRLKIDPRIALVRLTTFGNRTARELRETLEQLVEQDVEGVVLDVRGNAGGALDAAVEVAELFLPEGAAIVSTRGRDGVVIDEFAARDDGPFQDLQLAVLVDNGTASASEIVAAALQDHQRAEIFGERSYGKGTVQQLLPLEASGSLLKLTAASYWRPSGKNIHRLPDAPESEPWGVTPAPKNRVPLTEVQRTAWYEWRRQRDLLDSEPTALASEDPPADVALSLAVQRLQEQLDE